MRWQRWGQCIIGWAGSDDAEKVLQAVVGSGQGNSDAVFILAHVRADRGQTDALVPLLKMALQRVWTFHLSQRCTAVARSPDINVEIAVA